MGGGATGDDTEPHSPFAGGERQSRRNYLEELGISGGTKELAQGL